MKRKSSKNTTILSRDSTRFTLLTPSRLSLDFEKNHLPKLDSSYFWAISNINSYRTE